MLLVFSIFFVEIAVDQPVLVAASEEENIDSFDVNPANRWSVSNVGFTATTDESFLNLTDVGDGSSDYYNIKRDLRSQDSKIEIKFRYSVDDTENTTTSDYLRFMIRDNNDLNRYIYIQFNRFQNSDYTQGNFIYYLDNQLNGHTVTMDSDEALYDGLVYILTMDYNILKTEFKVVLKHLNNTKVLDYTTDEIFDYIPNFSAIESPFLDIFLRCNEIGVDCEILLDYVKAPFKEREWKQRSGYTPTDSDWLDNRWDLAYVQDDINDDSMWYLTVPYLDTISGRISARFEDETTGIDDGNYGAAGFALFAVDADDGELHEVFLIVIAQIRSDIAAGPDWGTFLQIYENGIKTQEVYTNNNGFPLDEQPAIDFSISLSEDRSKAALKTRFYIDVDSTDYSDYVAEIDITDVADVPSQEFVIMTYYEASFTADNEWIALVEDFSFTERDIFADIVNGIIEPIGNFLASIFTALIRFVAGIFKIVGDILSAAILALQQALTPLLESVNAWLGSVVTELQGLASDVASEVWSGIGSALDFITDAIDGLWATLEPVIGDIVSWLAAVASDIADFAFAVIEFLIALLLTIAEDLFNLIATIVFWVWDALGLPDLLAILDFLLVGIVALITDGLAALQWLVNVMAWWSQGIFFLGLIVCLAIPVFKSEGKLGEFGDAFIQYNSWNILPISALGFEVHIPVGVIFWPLLFMYVFALTGVWA